MRYLVYLAAALAMEVLAFVLAPVLPLFARNGYLPGWLAWFQTPDYSLYGDPGWQSEHVRDPRSYWSQVRWLLRNRAYGFKWSVLAAPVDLQSYSFRGNPDIKNRHNAVAGWLHVTMGEYWQWKWIAPLPGTSMCVMLNFGWLLDPYYRHPSLAKTQPRALFMFSPRLAAFFPAAQ